MRIIILVGDGMGDRPLKALGGKTPLEEASTPNMDEVAKHGICGIMDPIAPGVRPGSAPSHLAILGYDPYKYYTGRGPFEAAGMGIRMEPTDVAFRCNFATINEEMFIVDRRAGRDTEGLDKLAAPLNGLRFNSAPRIQVEFKNATAHRAVLILRGQGLSSNVSDTDPEKINVPPLESRPLDDAPASALTAQIVNEFVQASNDILNTHEVNRNRVAAGRMPANYILVRGAGHPPKMHTLMEMYGFNSSACIAEVSLVKGVAFYAGMEIIDVPGSTAGLDSDIRAIGREALEALPNNELVLVNVKGSDVAGHDGNIEGKIEIIERIDEMVGDIWEEVNKEETYVVLTADHSTPIEVKDHSGDPVPLAIAGPMVRVDEVTSFNERSVAKGGLGRIRGVDLMPILIDLVGIAKKFGA